MENRDRNCWRCDRCTHENHPIDKKCTECLAPKEISYPNLPDKLPIPNVSHPYPPREFTTSTSTSTGAISRKEVPPIRTRQTKYKNRNNRGVNPGSGSVSFVPWTNDSKNDGETPIFGSGTQSLNFPSPNIVDGSQVYHQGDWEGFLLPRKNANTISPSDPKIIDLTYTNLSDFPLDLSKKNNAEEYPIKTNDSDSGNGILNEYSPIDLISDKSGDSSGTGDVGDLDFREQSIGGFRGIDFPSVASPMPNNDELLHHKVDVDNKLFGNNHTVEMESSWKPTENLPEPPQTGSNSFTPSTMFTTRPTMLGNTHLGNSNMLSSPIGANAFDIKNWSPSDYDGSGSFSLLYPPGMSSGSGTNLGVNEELTTPIISAPKTVVKTKKSPSTVENKFKKVMPMKNHKPMPKLGVPSKYIKRYSDLQILSLYDKNAGDLSSMDEEVSMSTAMSEISSTRTATVLPPPGFSTPHKNVSDTSDDEFDPFAPKKTLEFKDEHFSVEETPGNKDDIYNVLPDPNVLPPSASNPLISGARRKTTRSKFPTVMPRESVSTGPSSSREPPPQPMLVDEKDHSTWPCPICTYRNRLTAQYCEVCHDGKPPWGTAKQPVVQTPTLTSPSEQDIQRKGASVKKGKSKAFVDDFSWICQECQTFNETKLTYCHCCGRDKDSISTPASSSGQASSSLLPFAQPTMALTLHSPIESSGPSNLHFLRERIPSMAGSSSSMEESISSNKIESIVMEKLRNDQEREANKIFNNINAYCKEARDSFVDDQFIPAVKSLYYPSTPVKPAVNWLRPNQIHTSDRQRRWTVFCDEGPQTTDIQQGILGNCWFLSGLSVLVERPDLLRKIFLTSEYNPSGVYMIRLCKDGLWQTVIIDDLLPCNMDNELLYTQAKKNQLWVPLIEKALAKINGCYEALQAGRSIEGLATLTGAPCESLQLMPSQDRDDFDSDIAWTVLLSSKNAGFLMGASCGGANMDVNENVYTRVDLRVRHAYGVLDVREERTDNNSMLKMLQLRNPWAQQSWSGDWSDNSDNWLNNPRLKRKIKPSQCGQGIFWLCFTDMLKYFDSVDICKIRDNNWAETRCQGNFPTSSLVPPSSYFIEVFQPTEIDLSIFQQGSRSQEGSGRHPVDLCICVYRSNDTATSAQSNSQVVLGPLVACSRRQVKRHGSCHHFFEPGIYQVVTLAFNHWPSAFGAGANTNSSENPKFVLALHSSRVIQLTHFTAHPTLFADATIELVMKKGEQKEVRECATCYYLTRGWAGLIVVAENRHPERFMHVVCDCKDSVNVVSTRGSYKTSDSIPPLHKQVLIVLTQLDGHSGFTITHKLTHRLGAQSLGDWLDTSARNKEHDPPFTRDVKALHNPRPL